MSYYRSLQAALKTARAAGHDVPRLNSRTAVLEAAVSRLGLTVTTPKPEPKTVPTGPSYRELQAKLRAARAAGHEVPKLNSRRDVLLAAYEALSNAPTGAVAPTPQPEPATPAGESWTDVTDYSDPLGPNSPANIDRRLEYRKAHSHLLRPSHSAVECREYTKSNGSSYHEHRHLRPDGTKSRWY